MFTLLDETIATIFIIWPRSSLNLTSVCCADSVQIIYAGFRQVSHHSKR